MTKIQEHKRLFIQLRINTVVFDIDFKDFNTSEHRGPERLIRQFIFERTLQVSAQSSLISASVYMALPSDVIECVKQLGYFHIESRHHIETHVLPAGSTLKDLSVKINTFKIFITGLFRLFL